MIDNYDTTIRVKHTTKERLAEHGSKDESYDKIVNRLLDMSEEHPVI